MTIQQQFLELLRAGIWNRPADKELFKGQVDWRGILRIAMSQTVQVLVADGIETLPQELWPSKDELLKLMMVRVKTSQMHSLLNTTLKKIVTALEAEGIPSVLLKGQGVAQNYPRPASRMCGDIDLYVGLKGYEKACEIIAALGDSEQEKEECGHHMHLKLDHTEVEVHRKAEELLNSRLNRKFQKFTLENLDANFNSIRLGTWNNGGTAVRLAPATFDAFFILHHAVRHMTTEGVGFRQICDWTMYLHRHHAEIDIPALKAILKSLHMETAWKEFGLLAVKHLGLPAEELPLCPGNLHSRKTDKLIGHIFISGNFGRSDANGRDYSKTTYLKRKWRSFRFQNLRLCKLFSLFPAYTISYWWGWLTNGIRVVLKGE